MTRRFAILAAICLIAGAIWLVWMAPPPAMSLAQASFQAGAVVRGAYHVHSTASDGTGSVDEIAAAAAQAGLDFVILTDHGDATRAPQPPSYRSGVLCIDAVEISTDEGHYVALGIPMAPYPLGGEARDVVEDVDRLGGFGIAAHPDSAKPDLAWREWETSVAGLEWFNADSQWRDEPRWRLPWTLLYYPARPDETVASIFDRPDRVIATWDALTQRHPVVAIAGHDAHQRLGLRGGVDPYDERWFLRLPTYEALFRSFAVRVVLDSPFEGRPAADADSLLAAIRHGRVYTAIDAVATPAAFHFEAAVGNVTARMGESVAQSGPIRVTTRSNAPPGATTVLLRNGRPIQERAGGGLEWTGTMPGVYRSEVRVAGAPGHPPIPWILSNPIYVGTGSAGRAARSLPPAVARMTWVGVSWAIEKDAGSAADVTALPAPGAPGIEIAYRLGTGLTPGPYVAAVTRDVSPMRDAARIAFRATADRPMRASVQVRLQTTDADQRWRRSFYADAVPRDVVFALDDLRPVRQAIGSRVDPELIAVLLFVIDRPNTAPGAQGRLTIDMIRTER